MNADITCKETQPSTSAGDIAASIRGRPIDLSDSDSNSNSRNENAQEVKFSNFCFPTPITFANLGERMAYHNSFENEKSCDLTVIGIGKEKFISYAAYFCKFEAQDKNLEVVSVQRQGKWDTLEDQIVETYPHYFGNKLDKIILVSENSETKVDFKTVDDLVIERPDIVNNCVLILVCPSAGSDMKAIFKLRPSAVLTTYEIHMQLMSNDFEAFLRQNEYPSEWDRRHKENYPDLPKYNVQEIAYQDAIEGAAHGKENSSESDSTKATVAPEIRSLKFRMVKLTKSD